MLGRERASGVIASAMAFAMWMSIGAQAQDADRREPTPLFGKGTHGNYGPADPNDPIHNCMAFKSTEPKPTHTKKKGPIRLVTKAIASELGTDAHEFLRDSMFFLSDKDNFDPYETKDPTDKPFVALEMQYIDGSQAHMIKYPDDSAKIVGGFADGTIIAPTSDDTYIVAYPNGVRGKMVQSGDSYKIYRPDKSVTTIKKTMSGDYEMTNDKLGYMGTARTDQQGMQYEFKTMNF